MFCDFTIDNWLTLISLLFVVAGGFFALYQWRKNIKVRRAEFITQILEKLRFDKELVEIMYMVEYGNKEWYNKDFHKNKELESSIDKLFSYLDYISYLKSNNNISKKEFKIFQYKINRTCVSISTKKYLWTLYHWSKKNNADCSFQFLIDYGIKNKLFPKDFKENTTLYNNETLNW